jgi:hypothetical protein
MNALILSAMMFAQAPDAPRAEPTAKPQATASLDGSWTVVCYEKNGQPMAEAKDCTVTVKDNVATFSPKDEKTKIMAIRIECGQNGTIQATEMAGAGSENKPADRQQAKSGVCVKSQDYVAICIHDAGANKAGAATPNAKTEQEIGTETKSYCTVILKRAGGSDRKENK